MSVTPTAKEALNSHTPLKKLSTLAAAQVQKLTPNAGDASPLAVEHAIAKLTFFLQHTRQALLGPLRGLNLTQQLKSAPYLEIFANKEDIAPCFYRQYAALLEHSVLLTKQEEHIKFYHSLGSNPHKLRGIDRLFNLTETNSARVERYLDQRLATDSEEKTREATAHASYFLTKLSQILKQDITKLTQRTYVELPFDYDFSVLFKESYADLELIKSKVPQNLVDQFRSLWSLRLGVGRKSEQELQHPLALSQDLDLVVFPVLNLSAEAACYLSQAAEPQQIQLGLMHAWYQHWRKTVHKQNNKLFTINSLITADNFTTTKTNRSDPLTSLFVDFEGRYGYVPEPNLTNSTTYEKIYTEFVVQCSLNEEPISLDLDADLDYLVNNKLLTVKNQLLALHSCPLLIDWSLNICCTMSSNDPSNLAVVELTGATCPSAIALNEALTAPLSHGLSALLGTKQPVTSVADWRDLSVKQELAAVYAYFRQQQKINELNQLLQEASTSIHQRSLTAGDFEYGVYARVEPAFKTAISDDCQLLDNNPQLEDCFDFPIKNELTVTDQQFIRDYNRCKLFFDLWATVFKVCGTTQEQQYRLNVTDEQTLTKSLAKLLHFYVVGRAFAMLCHELRELLLTPNNSVFSTNSPPKPVFGNYAALPSFHCICYSLMPFVTTFGFILTKTKTIADLAATEQAKFTPQGLPLSAIPDGSPNFEAFKHQAHSLEILRNEPRTALIDVQPGGGKCLEKSALVPTNMGLLTLKELWQTSTDKIDSEGFKPLIVDVVTTEGIKSTSHVYKTQGETYRVTFSDGGSLEGLGPHRLYRLVQDTELEFTELTQLLVGDYLPKYIGTRIFGSTITQFSPPLLQTYSTPTRQAFQREQLKLPKHLTLELAELLGFIFAQTQSQTLCCSGSPKLVRWYQARQRQVFGGNAPEITNRVITDFIQQILYNNQQKLVIPQCIRVAPEKYQRAFLRAVFASVETTITWTTPRRKLALGIKALLENIGILTSIQIHKGKSKGKGYTVAVIAQHYQLFADKIGFIGCPIPHISKKKLKQHPAYAAYYELLPCRKLLEKLIRRIADITGVKYSSVATTRHTVDRFLQKIRQQATPIFKDPLCCRYLEQILWIRDRIWLQVTVVQKTGKIKPVYDLSVPGPHNYVVHSLMGHNTLILLSDCLMLMGQQKVKRPLFIVPQSLIKNWITDLNLNASHCAYNCIAITTKTVEKWGENKLQQMIAHAPPNTLFFTDMTFMGNPSRKFVWQLMTVWRTIYGNLEWLKQFNFDYLGIDECHLLKNTKGANGGSIRSRLVAELTLNPRVKYLRLASGTIISNDIDDIIGQTRLFDPSIFRNHKHFLSIYSTDNNPAHWTPEAALKVRQRLAQYCAVIQAKRKDWAYALPVPVIQHPIHWFVPMDAEFKTVYTHICTQTLNAIKQDPYFQKKLNNWESLLDAESEHEDHDDSQINNRLQIYLDRLETFLNAPEADPLNGWNGLDFSKLNLPKIPQLIRLLDAHFKSDTGKVIIFVRHIASVEGILNRLPPHYRQQAIGYHYAIKGNLSQFKTDDKIKIIVGVEQSMNTGENLQIASRIIRLELCWTPGEIEQAVSRSFRPDFHNQYKRMTVACDWILCDDSLEVPKLGRLIAKTLNKVKFDEYSNPNYQTVQPLSPLPMNLSKFLDDLDAIRCAQQITPYLDAYYELMQIQFKEYSKERQRYQEQAIPYLPIPVGPKLPGAQVLAFTPLVPEQNFVPIDSTDGLVPFKEWLNRHPHYLTDLEQLFAPDHDVLVYTEFGYGYIYQVARKEGMPNSVIVMFSYGDKRSIPTDALYVATTVTPDTEQAKKYYGVNLPTSNQPQYQGLNPLQVETGLVYCDQTGFHEYRQTVGKVIEIKTKPILPKPPRNEPRPPFLPRRTKHAPDQKLFISAHPHAQGLLLVANAKDPDHVALADFGFHLALPFVGLELCSQQELTAALNFLRQNFKLKFTKQLKQLIDGPVTGWPLTTNLDFLLRNKPPTTQPSARELTLDYLVAGQRFHLVFDATHYAVACDFLCGKTCSGVTAKFRQHQHLFMCNFSTPASALDQVQQINKVVNIVNYSEIEHLLTRA